MQELIHNEWFVIGMASIIIFALTQLLKTPIKFFTNRISNERVRRMVNATILIIPFALGVLFEFAYSYYIGIAPFSWLKGYGYGLSATAVYGFAERFFKVPNPYKTEEGEAAISFAEAVVKDGKVDESDKDHIKEFWDKVK